jgi:2-polyprenyl-3-methyl-5-hydroxy-6-metoxy-1,4-benzoquinol methylase
VNQTKEKNASFPKEAFERLAKLEENSWWFNARNRLIHWMLDSYTSGKGQYIEIGCGTGFVLNMVAERHPEFELKGAEFYDDGLSFARQRVPEASFEQLDARQFSQQSVYDVIAAYDVLEHIDQDQSVLNNIHTALNDSGKMCITVPQHKWLWSVTDEYAGHERRYTKQELINKVEAAGFKVDACFSFVSLLLPLMWLSRLNQPSLESYDPLKEHQIAPWLNKLLDNIMKCELFLIKKGIRFPLGGSLALIASK